MRAHHRAGLDAATMAAVLEYHGAEIPPPFRKGAALPKLGAMAAVLARTTWAELDRRTMAAQPGRAAGHSRRRR